MTTEDNILKFVSDHLRISTDEMRGKARWRAIVEARQIFCYICRKLLPLSLSQIGNIINKDHATVLHSVKTIEDRISVYPDEKIFLDNYASNDCVISKACEKAGLNEDRIRGYLVSDPIFREALSQVRAENLRKIKTKLMVASNTDYSLPVAFKKIETDPSTIEEVTMINFLKKFADFNWTIAATAREVGVSPSTVRKWKNKYPEFNIAITDMKENEKDYVESRLMDFIGCDDRNGAAATMFYLKTKGQDRGYIDQKKGSGDSRELRDRIVLDAIFKAAIKRGIPENLLANKELEHTKVIDIKPEQD